MINMPSVEKVLKTLKTITNNPDKVTQARMWVMELLEELDSNEIEKFVEEEKNLVNLLKKEYHLDNQQIRQIAGKLIRVSWSTIDRYIGNVERTRSFIVSESTEPVKVREVLYSKEGTEYLNEQLGNVYDFLMEVGWGE